jgi:hypothetical protein
LLHTHTRQTDKTQTHIQTNTCTQTHRHRQTQTDRHTHTHTHANTHNAWDTNLRTLAGAKIEMATWNFSKPLKVGRNYLRIIVSVFS